MARAKTREPGKIVGGTNRNLALPNDLDSLSDVTAATPTDGQVLQYVDANSEWEPTDLPGPIKTYVDGHVQTLAQGTLRHAVEEILSTPPATPKGLYIVGKNATDEWAGHEGKIAIQNPLAATTPGADKWFFMEPHNNEERLVKSEDGVYQYVASTKEWAEISVGGGAGSVAVGDTAPANPGTGDMWLPGTDVLHVYDGRDSDSTKHRWRPTSGGAALETIEDNIKKTRLVAHPTGSTRLQWTIDGVLETKTANSTPVMQFQFKAIENKVFDIRSLLVRGVWRGHSHTSWDYGSATHVQTYELRSADELSLGWFTGTNRGIGNGEPFQIKVEVYRIGNKTCVASEWMGIRETDDHMTSFRGLYIFAIKFEEIEGVMLHLSQNIFSYHGRATWA